MKLLQLSPALLLPLLVLQTLAATKKKPLPLDCEDLYNYGSTHNGVYTIYPGGAKQPLQVYCDMGCAEDGSHNKGQWTVIQRRMDGTVNFYRTWKKYKNGFGDVEGEHWIGLENIFLMTHKKKYLLKVDMGDFDDATAFAQYNSFYIDPESNNYQLHVSGFIDGGAGDSLSNHNGINFSTFDSDFSGGCLDTYAGGFWYSCWYSSSLYSNPNGIYKWGTVAVADTGVMWSSWKGTNYSMKSVVMKIRRLSAADLIES